MARRTPGPIRPSRRSWPRGSAPRAPPAAPGAGGERGDGGRYDPPGSRPNPGDAAPAFRMTADDGQLVSTEGLAGTRFVLYFYPKDDTPGCTRQACSRRANWEQMLATGAEIFGVSPASVASHVKFRAQYDLPYRLLSDAGHA